tara:strand:- start:333 stop:1046 length:714 start_codon:yes stop_codon:yes gene_type:complete
MIDQGQLFDIGNFKNKTYRAIRHDVTRERQSNYCNTVHHPDQKINQIKNVLNNYNNLKILELFAGKGNLTSVYANYGSVVANELKDKVYKDLLKKIKNIKQVECNKVDSFLYFHKLISQKKHFNIIDLDPYGFPNRFFPDIFLLIKDGFIFITMPKPYVNILNGITQTHLSSYYGNPNPSMETIIDRIAHWGLCHWRRIELVDYIDCKSIWRFAFSVKKVKATDYTGVNNRKKEANK